MRERGKQFTTVLDRSRLPAMHERGSTGGERERGLELARSLIKREHDGWAQLLGGGRRRVELQFARFPPALGHWLGQFDSVEAFEKGTGFWLRGIPDLSLALPKLYERLSGVAERDIFPREILKDFKAWAPAFKPLELSYWDWLRRPKGRLGWKDEEGRTLTRTDDRGVPMASFVAKWVLLDANPRGTLREPFCGDLPRGGWNWAMPYADPEAPLDVLRARLLVQDRLATMYGIDPRAAQVYVPTAVELNALGNRLTATEQKRVTGVPGTWDWTRTPYQLSEQEEQVVWGSFFDGIKAVTHVPRIGSSRELIGPRFAIDFTEYPGPVRWPYPLV